MRSLAIIRFELRIPARNLLPGSTLGVRLS
jgi:hypothetical protein